MRAMVIRRGRWSYWLLLFCLADLSGHSHELVHHIVVRAMCGSWGRISFWVFELPPDCQLQRPWITTLAGPLFTYGLAWLGAGLILAGRKPFGVALVFSQFTWGRLVTSFFTNDELLLRKQLLAPGAWGWLVELFVLLVLALPPLLLAARTLARAGMHRTIWVYLLTSAVGWLSFFGWNLLVEAWPLGETNGIPRFYFIIMGCEAVALFLSRHQFDRFPAEPVAAGRLAKE